MLATMAQRTLLKQQCPLAFVVLAWVMYIGGAVVSMVSRQWIIAGTWIVLAPVTMWVYVKWFPAISPLMGYGNVDDVPAVPARSTATVTLYTALGCPFCPIVTRRLHKLQSNMGFALREVDVTARPDILTRKGVWSVPVIEVGDRRIVGHATSEQLAAFIASGADQAMQAGPSQLGSLTPRNV
jgi:glutaredoxin